MSAMTPLDTTAVRICIAITVWIGSMAAGCSSDDNAVETETPDVGADTSIDASFAEDVDVSDVSDDVHDVSFDTDDDSSYEPSWSECDCPNPEEKCTIRHFCGRPDAECDPGTGIGCPEGYTCQRDHAFGDFVCICKGEHEMCTPECDSQEDCPESMQSCSYDDGVCRWNRNNTGSCLNSMQCPDGYYCSTEYSRCQPTGDRSMGQDCEVDAECNTGICNQNTGKCDEQCLTDEDCDEGETCARFGGDWQGYNGCWEASCDVSCPPAHRCSSSECLPPACKTTGDCDVGDCRLDTERPEAFLPSCIEHEDSDVDHYCKPEERFSDAGYCYTPGTCWDDSHCDEPYVCEFGECRREIDVDQEDT